jgi:hypothetical protein
LGFAAAWVGLAVFPRTSSSSMSVDFAEEMVDQAQQFGVVDQPAVAQLSQSGHDVTACQSQGDVVARREVTAVYVHPRLWIDPPGSGAPSLDQRCAG